MGTGTSDNGAAEFSGELVIHCSYRQLFLSFMADHHVLCIERWVESCWLNNILLLRQTS